ncbi:hypothetical protein PRIPAC_83475 [Pristionchus pacificus]|uniref:Uncharacterized protein n=1 Tax=Pristionchus pacificus TaxID=54126 RepID=A0A2A6BTI2_PRIPA|nr:hypothetical protein PRIPAC_83475 [Pristionchus pacificus]|eukprot:PDM69239.1 hypothetical protein PRIPAC_47541 [Pristionchus pacificus]
MTTCPPQTSQHLLSYFRDALNKSQIRSGKLYELIFFQIEKRPVWTNQRLRALFIHSLNLPDKFSMEDLRVLLDAFSQASD